MLMKLQKNVLHTLLLRNESKSLKTGHFMYLSYFTLKTFSKQMIRNVAEEFMFKLLFEVIFIIARTT